MAKPALVTVTHDPKGKNYALFEKLRADLEKIYSELFITISDETSLDLKNSLEKSAFTSKVIPKQGVAHARRETVRLGLTGDSNWFHYCDFDRLLTWANRYFHELEALAGSIPEVDYLIFGRTERAFQTHLIEWTETEKITNRIFSLELGEDADVTAGSCSFSRASAEVILKHSKERMTDAEWPMIIHRIARRKVGYQSVEGLEYREDINGMNRAVSDSQAWLGRLKLSMIISESAVKTGKGKDL